MTTPTTARQFIRYVRTDDVRRAFGRHGAHLPGLILDAQLSTTAVRALADDVLARGDQLYPQRPQNVADELRQLAYAAETRLLSIHDEPVYSDAEIALLREAEQRCRARSVLLDDVATNLDSLTADWRSVGHMQFVGELLDDVDLLVPGIAERLRPLVELPETGGDE